MKILHAIQSVDASGGGPIEGIGQLSRAATRSTHHVVSVDPPNAPCVLNFKMPLVALGPPGFLGYSSRLAPWIKTHANEYDAVIIHGLWRYISYGTWRGLRGSTVPYFAFPHGMLDPWFKHQYPVKHFKKTMFWYWTEYLMLRDSKAVIFTCDDERLRARESFRHYRCTEEIAVLGIQLPTGDAAAQRQCFLEKFPQLQNKRLLLFLSRIHPKKGCDQLIAAFAQAASRDPQVHLVMAGPDQTGWGDELRRMATKIGISDRITWTGMLSGNLKWGAYHASEAFILPSHQENFGIVVAEALACSLPVLISNQVQIWREIVAAKAGFVASDDTPGTLQLIECWLDATPEQWQMLRMQARDCFLEKFQVEKYAARFEEIIVQHCMHGTSRKLAAA